MSIEQTFSGHVLFCILATGGFAIILLTLLWRDNVKYKRQLMQEKIPCNERRYGCYHAKCFEQPWKLTKHHVTGYQGFSWSMIVDKYESNKINEFYNEAKESWSDNSGNIMNLIYSDMQ